MRCGFWPLIQWYENPCSSQSFPCESTRSFLKKHNIDGKVQLCDIYRRFFICSHLAVGRHHRRRTPWCPHGLHLSRVKVFLTDHMHSRSWINHKLSLLQLSCWGTWENPHFCRREECSLVVRFELVNIFGKIPSLALGTSLLSFSLFMGLVLKIHCVGTSLMLRYFDICFSQRWSFLFPDTCVTQLGLSESNSLNCVQDFLHRVSPKLFHSLRSECIGVLWKPNPRFCLHFLFFLGSSLSSAFYLVVHQPCNEETNTCLLTYSHFLC